jgi:hypothetical protein
MTLGSPLLLLTPAKTSTEEPGDGKHESSIVRCELVQQVITHDIWTRVLLYNSHVKNTAAHAPPSLALLAMLLQSLLAMLIIYLPLLCI